MESGPCRKWATVLMVWAGGTLCAVAGEHQDDLALRVRACTACHGKDGRAGSDGWYPRIAGKPAGYLFNQLQNFRDGRRHYPLMIWMVQHMNDPYLQEIADWFAAQHPPYAPPQAPSVGKEVLARGEALVKRGDPARKLPACTQCHGERLTGSLPAIPGLLGLPRDYLSAQFGAWRTGKRRAHPPDCMAQIAQTLSQDEVSAAAAWLAAQPVPPDPSPAPAMRLPQPCGTPEVTP